MKHSSLLLLTALMPAISLAALKPEAAVAPVELFGKSVDLTPGLRIGIADDSNIYTEPAAREDSSLVVSVNPYLVARIGNDEEFSELQASVTVGSVSENSADDFTDYLFGYTGKYMLAGNLALNASLASSQGHDERGSSRTLSCTNNVVVAPLVACAAEPDVFQDVTGSVALTLGSPDSRGRVTFGVDGLGRRYASNGFLTAPLEYDSLGTLLRFGWNVGGKTRAVFEMKRTAFDYFVGGTAADSVDMEYLVGAEWEATGKTTGYALVGVQEKDFDAPARVDLSEPAARMGVLWQPSERTALNLELARRIDESSVAGTTAKETTSARLRASHFVNDRVQPYVSLGLATTDYAGVLRSDEEKTMGLGVDYKFRRWAVLGISWSLTDDSSNVGAGAFDYERNVIAIRADLTL